VTLLMLLLLLAVIGGIAAVAAGMVTGGLDDPASSVPARELPLEPPTSADVAALRFAPALRGYRMDQVDAAMDRLAAELDRLHAQLADRDRRLTTAGSVVEPSVGGWAPPQRPDSDQSGFDASGSDAAGVPPEDQPGPPGSA
jgi:DivIVA domain-containing protein